MTSESTPPNDRTRKAESEDAHTTAHADRLPSEDEEKAAEGLTLDPEVAAHEKEMDELGAKTEGEGRLP